LSNAKDPGDVQPPAVNRGTGICGDLPTPVIPAVGIYATPTATGGCHHNNNECNPFCTLGNWEGGEIWKQISTLDTG
jgi:hypothetical protein